MMATGLPQYSDELKNLEPYLKTYGKRTVKYILDRVTTHGGKNHRARKGSLESYTVAELRTKAAKRSVSLKGLTKKCDIIAKLRS